jgi:hypothetical protein
MQVPHSMMEVADFRNGSRFPRMDPERCHDGLFRVGRAGLEPATNGYESVPPGETGFDGILMKCAVKLRYSERAQRNTLPKCAKH